MSSLALVVAVGVAVLVSTGAARRWGVAPPALLLIAGVLLGFVPALRAVHMPPEAVLLLFLPVLLYWESFTASLREIRSNMRVIVLLSTVLVAATAAVAAHGLGMPWGPAWVLGGAVAPTDATAVGVLGRILPRRLSATLRAESLVNDGTALVIYALAVGVTMGEEHVSALRVGGMFTLSYLGGLAIGLVVTYLAIQVRKRLTDPFSHTVLAIITPLTAYLIAELADVSGVLAVVVCGLWVGRVSPRLFPGRVRQYVRTVMNFLTTLANAALFVLVGLEAQSAVRGLSSVRVATAVALVVVVSAVIVGVRFGWMFTSPYVIRAVDRRQVQRTRRLGARARAVMAAAGFRGAVSLAAALSVPEGLPDRDLIIFVTAGVIAVTLVVQAPLLPRVLRWARLGADGAADEERRRAEIAATEQALTSLPGLAERLGADDEMIEQLRAEYERHLRGLRAGDDDTGDAAARERRYADLRLAVIEHKHDAVVRMRDAGEIDDAVLARLENTLDLEAVNLAVRRGG